MAAELTDSLATTNSLIISIILHAVESHLTQLLDQF
ncbi:hypothetical protein NIES4071_13770 [Calothrix sp. NIES-4071]|nr:hypothetical protein NIES4071_13770 [Calothrix sp. NIES-4071]